MKHHPQCPAMFGYRCDCAYGTEKEHSSGSFRPEPKFDEEESVGSGDQSDSGKDWYHINLLIEQLGSFDADLIEHGMRKRYVEEYRGKWDGRRGNTTYLRWSINHAIAHQRRKDE